jgi:hypothetical protein
MAKVTGHAFLGDGKPFLEIPSEAGGRGMASEAYRLCCARSLAIGNVVGGIKNRIVHGVGVDGILPPIENLLVALPANSTGGIFSAFHLGNIFSPDRERKKNQGYEKIQKNGKSGINHL